MPAQRNTFADRAFRFLLRFFPSEFRGDYGREMEQVFQAQRRESQRNKAGLLRLWGETITGIFTTAPREHLEMFRQDGGYALRMMRKNMGFTVLVISILALGIGANTAIFSVVNGALLRPLPYANGSRLVTLTQSAPKAGYDNLGFSAHEIEDYRQSRTLDQVVEYHTMAFNLVGEGEPQRVVTRVVSANFFEVLGVKPLLGRTFVAADDAPGAPPVLVFSYEYWKEHYGNDSKIIGKQFHMNGKVHTLIGVLPQIPQYPTPADVYMPVSACPFRSNPATINDRTARMVAAFGRLRAGATLAQAQQEISGMQVRMVKTFEDDYPNDMDFNIRGSMLQSDLTKQARPTFLILLATAGLVLLLVCANVANLSLSRQLRREREMSIRAAVGASRSRLLRQMVTESTILSLAGGALGVLLAWNGLDLLISFAARFTPRAHEITLDGRVLVFSLGISLLTGIVFGSIPAMFSTANPYGGLKEGARSDASGKVRQRLRGSLVVAQVAVSFALLAGAGLLLRSFYKLTQVNPGFRPEHVISMLVDLDFDRYKNNSDVARFHNALLEKVNANPFVLSSAIGLTFPLNQGMMGPMTGKFEIQGRKRAPGEPMPVFDFRSVTPGYFKTLNIPLIRGRYLTESDSDPKQAPLLINESMARHYWGNEDPIGAHVTNDGGKTWNPIVGIVGDVRQYGLDKSATDEIYCTQAANPTSTASLLVRTSEDPRKLIRQLTELVYSVDPNQPVSRVKTLEQLLDQSLAPPRLTSALLGGFALLALIITAAGIMGVMAISVSQRTKEIGIRMALGASQGSVLRLVLRQGLTLIVVGLAFGVGLAMSGTKLMQGLLFGIEPGDPLTLVGVTVLLVTVAALSCYGPARRATSVDPLTALRSE
ncbi:MAG TPA: ABC transporter permease [Candidatus Acidoferrales bacterium]|nr:ABC transporter permease [Candidatus Acidoferrales bacterium]